MGGSTTWQFCDISGVEKTTRTSNLIKGGFQGHLDFSSPGNLVIRNISGIVGRFLEEKTLW